MFQISGARVLTLRKGRWMQGRRRIGKLTRHVSFSSYRGLPHSIYALFFARIVNSVGSFVHPFMALFLTDRLGLGEGVAGRYILASSMAFVPGSLIAGKLSDRIGRKRILVLAQAASALCFLPCGFLDGSIAIAWFLIASQFFLGGVYPVSQAITADLTKPRQRQAAYSLIYLGTNIGFALGPLIAGILYKNHVSWLFFGDAGTTFLSLIVILLFVAESKPSDEDLAAGFADESEERSESGSALAALLRRPFLLAFLCIIPLLNFIYSQLNFSMPLYLMELHPENGSLYFGTVMTANAVTVALFTTVLVSMTSKFRPVITVALAALFYAVGFGSLGLELGFLSLLLSVMILTFGEVLAFTNTNVYVANHTPMTHRGRFNAIFPILLGAGFALGPPITGPFIEKYGVRFVWPVMAVLGLLVFFLLLLLAEIERRMRKS